jgi:hypothetical protein
MPRITRAKSLSFGKVNTVNTVIPRAKSLPLGKAKTLSMKAKITGVCSRILTPKQVGPICWFMATFVAMFYSQRSRKILLEASKGWDNENKLFILLKQILHDKYTKTASTESEDYWNFRDDTFTKVLTYLNEHDPQSFPYNPQNVSGGFLPEYYIGKFYKLLHVDYRIYEFEYINNSTEKNLYYSFLNEEFNSMKYSIENRSINIEIIENHSFKYSDIEASIQPPQILIVQIEKENDTIEFFNESFPNTIIDDFHTIDALTSMKDKIKYRGCEYHLDSVVLENWNQIESGHAIAGITCEGYKYIYNGWTRKSMDPVMANQVITRNIPCELMPYDWNVKHHGDFCLNPRICIPDTLKINAGDLCFNFSKGSRILVYVRTDAISANVKNTRSITKAKTNTNNVMNVNDKNLFVTLKTFLISLSNEIEKKTTFLKRICDSYTPYNINELINGIGRYFDDEMIPLVNQRKHFANSFPNNFEKIIKHYILNIYSQLLNPSVKKASSIEYLSYTNRIYFKRTMLSAKIKEHLVSFMNEYEPRLDYKLYRYMSNIIDDMIDAKNVEKLLVDNRDVVTEDGAFYRNDYYLLLSMTPKEHLRLPKGMGLLTDIEINDGHLIVDDSPHNNFTYEECKMWVTMPIIHPRTFTPIKIDSPIYNRLMCLSYQYDTHLIPRMITSQGYEVIYIITRKIKDVLSNTKNPPQTRKQLEKYIYTLPINTNTTAKKGMITRIFKGMKGMLKNKKVNVLKGYVNSL